MERIRTAIIGIGNMGSAHLDCICNNEVPSLEVTAVCDIDENKGEKALMKYPSLAVFTDYKKLLESKDIDAVIIAVPHPLHAEIAIKALNSGKHVLVEKPVDITVSAAEKLNKTARDSGKVFGIMFNQRTNQLYAQARQIVKDGTLGDIKRSVWIITNWYRTQSYYNTGSWRATWAGEGGGVLLNQAPHNLDLWQWICGMPETVTAFCYTAKFHNIEVEDEATIYTEYRNGATGIFITSTGDFPGTNRLEISGTLGKMVLENGKLKLWRLKEDEREVCKNSDEGFCSIENEYTEFTAPDESAHKGILNNFADAVIKGTPLLAPGYDGINELSISNAAYLSEWKGNIKISLPFDEDEFDRMLHEKKAASKGIKTGKDVKPDKLSCLRWKVRW